MQGFFSASQLPSQHDRGCWWALFQEDVSGMPELPIPSFGAGVVERNDKVARCSCLQAFLDHGPGSESIAETHAAEVVHEWCPGPSGGQLQCRNAGVHREAGPVLLGFLEQKFQRQSSHAVDAAVAG